MARGTTAMAARSMVAKSNQSRPATSGNKSVRTRRNAQANPTSMLNGRATRPLVGPDKGAG